MNSLLKEKKVLTVDDDLNMRIFISTLLKTNGFDAFTARDGKEGVKKAKEVSPSLIILDLMMPGDGGIKMYRKLKKDEKLRNIPVIVLSGVESKAFHHSLKMLGLGSKDKIAEPDAYIEKPPNADELIKVIKSFF